MQDFLISRSVLTYLSWNATRPQISSSVLFYEPNSYNHSIGFEYCQSE